MEEDTIRRLPLQLVEPSHVKYCDCDGLLGVCSKDMFLYIKYTHSRTLGIDCTALPEYL